MRVVAGWHDDRHVYLVERRDGVTQGRRARARWTLFARDVTSSTRRAIAGVPEVETVTDDGPHRIRIECKGRNERLKVRDALTGSLGREAVLEADVDPLTRFLADAAAVEVDPTPRVLLIDLEAQHPDHSLQDAREGKVPILSWAARDLETGAEYNQVLSRDDRDRERALLRMLLGVMANYDVIVAWYGGGDRPGEGFDFDCLRERCRVLGLEPPVNWRRWCWLDHLRVYEKFAKNAGGDEKATLTLGGVAGQLCGDDVGKIDLPATQIWDTWSSGPEGRRRLLDYNVQDVRLMGAIEDKTGFLSLFLAVCHLCRVFPNTRGLMATAQGDGFLLRRGAEMGHRWPTRWDPEGEPFSGAFVFQPTRTGAIDNVAVADFSALYPSIMRTWGISPEAKTLRPTGVAITPESYTRFDLSRPGIMPTVLEDLQAMRARYAERASRETPGTTAYTIAFNISFAAKTVTNSFYGIVGSPFSRFYDRECAEAVTTTGAWVIQRTIKWAQDAGWEVIYADTDSIFVVLPSDDDVTFREFVAGVNRRLEVETQSRGCRESHLNLDYEKCFRRLLLVRKKRYAGRLSLYKGKPPAADAPHEVRGLELRRGDTLRMTRRMQEQAVDLVLGTPGGEVPDSPRLEDAMALFDRWRWLVLEDDLDPRDVVITQGLSRVPEAYRRSAFNSAQCAECKVAFPSGKAADGPDKCSMCGHARVRSPPPPHARVAIALNEAGAALRPGDRVAWVAVVDADAKKWSPAPAEDHDPGQLDRGYYWRRAAQATVRMLQVVWPDAELPALAREERAARLSAIQQVRARDNSDLPLFAGLSVAHPDQVTIHLGSSDPEAVSDLGALILRCSGPSRVVIVVDTGEAEVTMSTSRRWDVDAGLLACDPRVTEVAPATYRVVL